MNEAIQLTQSSGLAVKGSKGKNKTPGDIGVSLFNNLLHRIHKSFQQKGWGLSLYETSKSIHGTDPNEEGKESHPLLSLNKKIRQIGVPVSQLVLPEAALPQLIFLLENQGVSKEQINQLVQSAKGNDGSFRVGPFLPFLMKQQKGFEDQTFVIQTKDVPRLEKVLYDQGMGAGEVKEVIEKSIKPNGDVDLGRLTMALSKFRGNHTEKDLISLLEQFNIQNKPRIIEAKGIDPELKKSLMNISQTPLQDVQQDIKQNISYLLMKKGIPPQDVKTFLEGLDIQYVKATLRAAAPQTMQSDPLLSQVTISNQTVWGKGGWDEKILGILRGERIIVMKDANKDRLEDKGEYRLNLTELLKHGDPKTRTELFQEVTMGRSGTHLEETAHQGKGLHGSKTRLHAGDKEGFASSMTMAKQDVEPSRIGSLDHVKNMVALPQPLPKILDRMIWMIRAGEQQGRMILNPPELGRLQLDLSIKHGHLQAHVNAENVVVKELIEANLVHLRQQLTDQGLIIDKFEVMVGLDDKQENEKSMWAWDGHGRGRRSKSNGDEESIESLSVDKEKERSTKTHPYQIDVLV
ncbi:MAG: flagellar hook-length control protein FliK [Deltaproteobacteria bacterium]|nr:flagellar hook-length control protein FliK [Deltaproteobacteria bacterium]